MYEAEDPGSLAQGHQGLVTMRARQGTIDDSHVVLFYLMKTFAPGSAEDKVQLIANVLNPNVCSQPRAAEVEGKYQEVC